MSVKINVSLSVKLTLIVISLSAISIIAVTYVNINSQEKFFWDQHYQKAASLLQAIHSTIGDENNLNNQEILEEKINQYVNSTHPAVRDDIKKITISCPDNQDEIIIIYSTDKDLIGSKPDYYKYHSLCYQSRKSDEDDYYFIVTDDKNDLIMISTLNLSGGVFGTSELVLSMQEAYAKFDNQVRTLIFISIICLFIIIFAFLILLRRFIVTPIIKFRDSAKIIGKGNLDIKVNIKSKDELGELATAFNQMAKDLKESRDKIHEYNKILENLIKQKDEFIGQLGHDLKNPLQPLVGLLPMLIEEEKDPEIKEALQVMNKNVEYMRDLIFKTLQLAKLRSANIHFDIQDINLYNEVENVIVSQKMMLEENKIDIENKIDNNIIVQADKLRLSELFKNLITNSVKYTPDTGGKIIIDAEVKDKDVTISVQDTGIGMTEDQLDKVFDEFYKANRFSSEYDSSGLGLAISKRIVEKHGGKIWVKSPGPGRGSVFYFTLRLRNVK